MSVLYLDPQTCENAKLSSMMIIVKDENGEVRYDCSECFKGYKHHPSLFRHFKNKHWEIYIRIVALRTQIHEQQKLAKSAGLPYYRKKNQKRDIPFPSKKSNSASKSDTKKKSNKSFDIQEEISSPINPPSAPNHVSPDGTFHQNNTQLTTAMEPPCQELQALPSSHIPKQIVYDCERVSNPDTQAVPDSNDRLVINEDLEHFFPSGVQPSGSSVVPLVAPNQIYFKGPNQLDNMQCFSDINPKNPNLFIQSQSSFDKNKVNDTTPDFLGDISQEVLLYNQIRQETFEPKDIPVGNPGMELKTEVKYEADLQLENTFFNHPNQDAAKNSFCEFTNLVEYSNCPTIQSVLSQNQDKESSDSYKPLIDNEFIGVLDDLIKEEPFGPDNTGYPELPPFASPCSVYPLNMNQGTSFNVCHVDMSKSTDVKKARKREHTSSNKENELYGISSNKTKFKPKASTQQSVSNNFTKVASLEKIVKVLQDSNNSTLLNLSNDNPLFHLPMSTSV